MTPEAIEFYRESARRLQGAPITYVIASDVEGRSSMVPLSGWAVRSYEFL
jgi:hypothetical protein